MHFLFFFFLFLEEAGCGGENSKNWFCLQQHITCLFFDLGSSAHTKRELESENFLTMAFIP